MRMLDSNSTSQNSTSLSLANGTACGPLASATALSLGGHPQHQPQHHHQLQHHQPHQHQQHHQHTSDPGGQHMGANGTGANSNGTGDSANIRSGMQHGGNSTGATGGDRLDASSDSAVSSMGSERVPSISDSEWGDGAGSDSAQEYHQQRHTKYGRTANAAPAIGPYDYSYSRGTGGGGGGGGGGGACGPQKKHHMFGKRFVSQAEAIMPMPSASAATTIQPHVQRTDAAAAAAVGPAIQPPVGAGAAALATGSIKYEYDPYGMHASGGIGPMASAAAAATVLGGSGHSSRGAIVDLLVGNNNGGVLLDPLLAANCTATDAEMASGSHKLYTGLRNASTTAAVQPSEQKYSCSLDFAARHQLQRGPAHAQEMIAHNHTYTMPPHAADEEDDDDLVAVSSAAAAGGGHRSARGDTGRTLPKSGRLTKQQQQQQAQHQQEMDEHLSRDEKRARQLQIPMPVQDIINLPMDEFNERLSKYDLSESQLSLIRDIRRRGKNKVAAQNCRKRKLDQIICLADEVKDVRERKERIYRDREMGISSNEHIKRKFSMLHKHIFQVSERRADCWLELWRC